jgi:ADP-heptose:LPS heptosyltransferase
MKVLIIRFSSIGDIVLTSPVIRCIKEQVPDVQVHYLTKSSFRPVVAHNPFIDKCYYLEDNLDVLIPQLKKEKYDYIIDLHNNIRTLKVKRALQCKAYSFPKLNVQKWILVNFKKNLLPDKSIVERYFEAARPLGVKNDGKGLDYYISKEDEVTNKDIPMSHWAGYIACVIGGSYATKKYPVEKWKELCRMSTYPIILLGGPDDRAEGDDIAEIDKVRVYNACGKFNLNESACLVKYAKVVISNDTGLMHVAAAFKKPVVSLWGNTVPEFGMFPYYGHNNIATNISTNSYIVENNSIGCRPCSKIGYNKCPKGHFKCMNELENIKITNAINKFWTPPQP